MKLYQLILLGIIATVITLILTILGYMVIAWACISVYQYMT